MSPNWTLAITANWHYACEQPTILGGIVEGIDSVQSHWNTLVTNFETSSLAFYDRVELALTERRIPDIKLERITRNEGGVGSASRTYLRVKRGRLTCDICGAQYGTGHFFSWWLAEETPQYAKLVGWIIVLLLPIVLFNLVSNAGLTSGFIMFVAGAVFIMWMISNLGAGSEAIEDAVLATPGIGPVYKNLFKPTTYYSVDTMMMYKDSIHKAVTEIIDDLKKQQGLRSLAPDELRPVERDFLR